MKSLFMILIAVTINHVLHAQNFAPVGAEWYYCEGHAFSDIESYIKVTVTKDTVIQNKQSQEVVSDWVCWNPSEIQYVHSSGDSVFLFDPLLDRFKLIYDFSAVPGDTIRIPVYDWDESVDSVLIAIDAVSTIIINNIELRHQFVTYFVKDSFPGGTQFYSYSSEIAEIIGDINFLFNFPVQASIVCDANFSCGLRCYEDSYLGHSETGQAPSCNFISVGLNEPTVSSLGIYPNPTPDKIYFNSIPDNVKSIELIDQTGRIIKKISSSPEINLEGLNQGMYFLRILDIENKVYLEKVIKQ